MKRRDFLLGGAGVLALSALAGAFWNMRPVARATATPQGDFAVVKSDAEWRAALSEEQYRVLRREGTERAFTSPLNDEKRDGMFHCAGCGQAVYASDTKFDSGTGWPSFWEAVPDAVGTRQDNTLFMTRTECHCSRCGGHLGHVFEDGPPPTGLRHCINGVALTFRPSAPASG